MKIEYKLIHKDDLTDIDKMKIKKFLEKEFYKLKDGDNITYDFDDLVVTGTRIGNKFQIESVSNLRFIMNDEFEL